jgi:L-seryl-tRNA(Ser) seleniumtransferase
VAVNNNAGATLVILAALAAGRDVVVSRGELVEIGGGFRVPEVMAQSGAILREVGTTNRTRLADYRAAIGDRTALVLRVHRSNFRIEGFTEQPSLEELAALGRERGIPVVEDLGSGLLFAASPGSAEGASPATSRLQAILRNEPSVQASLAAGIDLVCFSGDKLLGGPQAGLIVGRADLVAAVRRHPLMRALRVDKMAYAALDAALSAYARGRAAEEVPVLRMLALSAEEIGERASALAARLAGCKALAVEVMDGSSMIGGGSAPGVPVPTRLLSVASPDQDASALEARLRRHDPPIIARVERDRLLLDLRTVPPERDELLARALLALGDCEPK